MKYTRTRALPGENFYFQVPHHWANDYRMPALAFRVLTYINKHQVGYTVRLAQVIAEIYEGRDAIYTAVRWLIDNRYLQVRQDRTAGGRWGEVEYELGPAAYEPDYERNWGGCRPTGQSPKRSDSRLDSGMFPQLTPLTDNPDADEMDTAQATVSAGRNVSAAHTAYGLAVSGSTASGQADAKEEQRTKKIKTTTTRPTATVPAPRPASKGGGGGDRLLEPNPEPPRPDPDPEPPRPGGPAPTDPDGPVPVDNTAAGRRVLERAQDASNVGRRRLRGTPLGRLAAAVGERLAAGWSEDDAVGALSGSLAAVDSVAAAMNWRVSNLLAGPPPSGTSSRAPGTPPAASAVPWCGSCESDGYRWRNDAQDRPYRCPECHPGLVTLGAR